MKPWETFDFDPLMWQLTQVLLFMLLYGLYRQAFAGEDRLLDNKESVQQGFFIILLLVFTGQPALMTETVVLTLIVCVTGERMLNSTLFTALLNRTNNHVSKNYPSIYSGAVSGPGSTNLPAGDGTGLPSLQSESRFSDNEDRHPLSAG